MRCLVWCLQINDIKASIKFQLKKVLCLGVAIGHVEMSEKELYINSQMAINFLVSLLKKNWQNVKCLYIKSSMGKPVCRNSSPCPHSFVPCVDADLPDCVCISPGLAVEMSLVMQLMMHPECTLSFVCIGAETVRLAPTWGACVYVQVRLY